MSDELKDQRIPIMMTASEVAAIDDWSFANRIRSRAEAIRRLCQTGLAYAADAPEIERRQEVLSQQLEVLNKAFDHEDTDDAEWTGRLLDAIDTFVDAAMELSTGLMVAQATGHYLASDNDKAAERAATVRQRFKDSIGDWKAGAPIPEIIDDAPAPPKGRGKPKK
jgi:hypothetical protein